MQKGVQLHWALPWSLDQGLCPLAPPRLIIGWCSALTVWPPNSGLGFTSVCNTDFAIFSSGLSSSSSVLKFYLLVLLLPPFIDLRAFSSRQKRGWVFVISPIFRVSLSLVFHFLSHQFRWPALLSAYMLSGHSPHTFFTTASGHFCPVAVSHGHDSLCYCHNL